MCGRFTLRAKLNLLLQQFAAETSELEDWPVRYNIAPTQDVLAVRGTDDGKRELVPLRWGLIPSWSKDIKIGSRMINARAETIDRKPLFRDAFATRRCLVPATGFYDWERREDGRQPFRYRMRSADPFAFAGLWEAAQIEGRRLHSTTIIVTEANELTAAVHDRMPVIIPPDAYSTWLDPTTTADEARELLRPFPASLMEAYPVSRAVNHYEKDDEECIQPIDLPAAPEDREAASDQPGLPGL